MPQGRGIFYNINNSYISDGIIFVLGLVSENMNWCSMFVFMLSYICRHRLWWSQLKWFAIIVIGTQIWMCVQFFYSLSVHQNPKLWLNQMHRIYWNKFIHCNASNKMIGKNAYYCCFVKKIIIKTKCSGRGCILYCMHCCLL